jgi:hypothetical protein
LQRRTAPSLSSSARSSPNTAHKEELASSRWCAAAWASFGPCGTCTRRSSSCSAITASQGRFFLHWPH